MSQEILGLPVEAGLPDDRDGYYVSPILAIAVVKAIDSDGDEVHAVIMSEGMTPVEGSGLLNFGKIYTDEILRKTFSAKNQSSKKK